MTAIGNQMQTRVWKSINANQAIFTDSPGKVCSFSACSLHFLRVLFPAETKEEKRTSERKNNVWQTGQCCQASDILVANKQTETFCCPTRFSLVFVREILGSWKARSVQDVPKGYFQRAWTKCAVQVISRTFCSFAFRMLHENQLIFLHFSPFFGFFSPDEDGFSIKPRRGVAIGREQTQAKCFSRFPHVSINDKFSTIPNVEYSYFH